MPNGPETEPEEGKEREPQDPLKALTERFKGTPLGNQLEGMRTQEVKNNIQEDPRPTEEQVEEIVLKYAALIREMPSLIKEASIKGEDWVQGLTRGVVLFDRLPARHESFLDRPPAVRAKIRKIFGISEEDYRNFRSRAIRWGSMTSKERTERMNYALPAAPEFGGLTYYDIFHDEKSGILREGIMVRAKPIIGYPRG